MIGMPMETHSQRWPTDVWAAIEIAAKYRGESTSAYVRIATLSRAAYDAARRGDRVTAGFDALWATAKELDQAAQALVEVYDLDDG